MTRDELKNRAIELKAELTRIDALLAVPDTSVVEAELPALRRKHWVTAGWLAFTLLASLFAICWQLSVSHGAYLSPCLLAAIGGCCGSAVSALLSANSRYAAGVEFRDGTSYPDQTKRERFNARLVPGFVFRPLIGAFAGLLIVALHAGFFGSANLSDLQGLLTWSILGGLFAKTLLDKLKDVFANLIGKSSA